ncbi:hypothetical protein FHG87_004590 [Trinorchestia longiramus]|nr:hypothetical protein FHG87_004590 [Trinorchestia longiramus]
MAWGYWCNYSSSVAVPSATMHSAVAAAVPSAAAASDRRFCALSLFPYICAHGAPSSISSSPPSPSSSFASSSSLSMSSLPTPPPPPSTAAWHVFPNVPEPGMLCHGEDRKY